MSENMTITVPSEHNNERIDRFLVHSLEINFSRSYIQRLIKNKHIHVNNTLIKQNYRVKTDDFISIQLPEPEQLNLIPENIPLDFIYDDESLAIVNKAPGMVVHPGPGNWEKTLVHALLFHLKDLSGIGGVERPGIVHRLDKDTCGLMIIAKNDKSHQLLSKKFENREIEKKYDAIVIGKPYKDHGLIEKPLGRHPKHRHKMTVREDGKFSSTGFSLEKIWSRQEGLFSQLAVTLHTGRTHQIRVHLASMGNPIVGDPIYSKRWQKYHVPFLLLAATQIEFYHPITDKKMLFRVPLPDHIDKFIKKLERN